MERPSDEELTAYLDGELDAAESAALEARLVDDTATAARLEALVRTDGLVREAFGFVLREAVPDHLLRAASGRGEAQVIDLAQHRRPLARQPRVWVGMAAAACLAVGLFQAGSLTGAPKSGSALDNIATYHNLFIALAEAREGPFDVTPDNRANLPGDVRVPDLTPWGLDFQGARKLAVEGKPAYQFYYTTDKHDLGAITVTLWSTAKPDSQPNFDKHENVNVMSWHHAGRGFAIMGHADKGYMWGLANDVLYQLKG